MDFKLLGSILLIVGTSIGAGMLALPIATAQLGFLGSLVLLVSCWFVMTIGALLILEVNLWLPQNSNLISMAKATLGPLGQIVTWITFILLLYSLLCAYIAGGSDLFHNLMLLSGLKVPLWLTAILFVSVFGTIVYCGIRVVDYANRGLMFVKLLGYFLLILFIAPFISFDKLTAGSLTKMSSAAALMVTITSFGYAAIVPSLRIYFAGDIRKLKTAIFVGSIIPLFCYILWDAAIMGVIPLTGEQSLVSIMQSKSATSDLVNILNSLMARDAVMFFAKLFTSVCVVTSFLGVALCLTDFLADGLKLDKKGGSNVLIQSLTFMPPLLIVLFFPSIFVQALTYAGIYCLVLLILLPACMAWAGRYRRHIVGSYRVWGGKSLLTLLIIFSVAMSLYGLIVG